MATLGVLAARVERLDDSLGFANPNDIRVIPGGYVVVDPRLNRLATLDASLRVREVIGRAGSGPGEFRFPRYVSSRPGTFAIKEEGNERISFFDERTLAFKRAMRIPRSGEFALLDEERVLLLASDSGAVGAIFSNDTVILLEDPPDPRRLAPPSDTRPAARKLADVTDSLAYVLDEQSGAVMVYELNEGRMVDLMLLPPSLWSPLLDATGDRIEGLAEEGIEVLGGGFFVKRLLAAGPGRVLILLHTDDAYGLMVDRNTRTVHPLVLPTNADLATKLANANSGVLSGDTLVVLSDAEILKVRLGTVS